MAITAQQLEVHIRNSILAGTKALGNTKRGLKEVCSDLVNKHLEQGGTYQQLQDGCFLSYPTLNRIAELSDAESGQPYRPNADTCERILRYFGTEITFGQIAIKPRYANKPKEEK